MTGSAERRKSGRGGLFVTERQLWSAALSAVAIAMLVGALWAAGESQPRLTAVSVSLGVKGELPSLDGAIRWLNSPPLGTGDLRGKVVLVEFWTYSCINWRRTLPYVRAWAEKYKGQGLVVIGVHTPEFTFEGDLSNVRQFTQAAGIEYPVAVDTDHTIWRAFNNQYWPALYLADARGRIRYHHFGEGAYEETELAIQQLLGEAGQGDVRRDLVAIDPQGIEAAADWRDLRSAETYTGYELSRGFASPGGIAEDAARIYTAPARLGLNQWAVTGNWTIDREAAVSNLPGGRVAFAFHARDVNLVMAPPKGVSVAFRVLIDGHPPGASHGVDVDAQGNGTLDRPMMYQLIRASPVTDHLFEIEFARPGISVFDFTFG